MNQLTQKREPQLAGIFNRPYAQNYAPKASVRAGGRTLWRVPYVVGALGSRPASSKGFRNSRSAQGSGGREPKGRRHAIDADTGRPACGTIDSLRVFDDIAWAADGEWCAACEALVPFE